MEWGCDKCRPIHKHCRIGVIRSQQILFQIFVLNQFYINLSYDVRRKLNIILLDCHCATYVCETKFDL